MKTFTELQSLILATLEEAGEDHLSALINTVGSRKGSIDEIDVISTALAGLIEGGLLRIASSRDKDSLRWIALRKDESLALLSSLKSFLQWSIADRLWKWQESFPRLEVLLTPAGMDAAQQILYEQGGRVAQMLVIEMNFGCPACRPPGHPPTTLSVMGNDLMVYSDWAGKKKSYATLA